MPVCIIGMHRSGTSMVARLLNLCGLYLGQEDELYPADVKDNPQGYWENQRFIQINDQILKASAGDLYHPPAPDMNWLHHSERDDILENAQLLVQRFSSHQSWGWKDPRTSLTLRFWLDLIPDLKVIICLRNPMEVALSLSQRDYIETVDWSLNLWMTYNQRILESVKDSPCVLTHYETYFYEPDRELRRLTDFAGLMVTEEEIQKAISTVSSKARHNITSRQLLRMQLSEPLFELYLELSQRAGPIYERMLADMDYQLQRLETDISRLYGQLSSGYDSNTASLEEKAEHLRQIIFEQAQGIESLETGYNALKEANENQRAKIEELTQYLNTAHEAAQHHMTLEKEYKLILQAYEAHTEKIYELNHLLESAQQTIAAQAVEIRQLRDEKSGST